MNFRLYSISLLLLLAGCGPKRNLPKGSPSFLKDADLWEQIDGSELQFNSLEIKGSGSYTEVGSPKLSFKFTIKVAKDSLIWIDLADPILGLKLVRGILSKEKLAYYNRLERNYFEGPSTEMAAKLGFNFEFEPLMALLGANVLRWNQDWRQVFVPAYYEFNNYPTDSLPPTGEINLMRQQIIPANFRPNYLELKKPTSGEILQINYEDYQEMDGSLYPEEINLRVLQSADHRIELKVRSLKVNPKQSYPFRIPKDYNAL